jgi:hypothetical protein
MVFFSSIDHVDDVLNLSVEVDVHIVRSCYIWMLNVLDRCVCNNIVH